jgi:TRAP-type C4-dicarboxylate transport system permease small subunit
MVINAMPPMAKKGLNFVLQLLGLAVILFFAYEATLWILRPEVRMESSPTTGLPIWINYAMFPITFYCMAVHIAVALISISFNNTKSD